MGVMKKAVNTGVGLAALAAAAGAYFLYGKGAAKNRQRVKGWMLKIKGEVLEKVENLKSANESAYREVVDQVTRRYRKMKDVNKKELQALGQDLKSSWKHINTKAENGGPAAKRKRKR